MIWHTSLTDFLGVLASSLSRLSGSEGVIVVNWPLRCLMQEDNFTSLNRPHEIWRGWVIYTEGTAFLLPLVTAFHISVTIVGRFLLLARPSLGSRQSSSMRPTPGGVAGSPMHGS